VEIARTYVVKEGDTYRSLAKRFGVRPRDLRALNGPLVVGERILIPAEPWVTDAPGD
jgi:LysM repeat protein